MAFTKVFITALTFSSSLFANPALAQDGVPVYVPATCSGSLDSSVQLGDLFDKTKGPALMRDIFCGTYDSKPNGATYDLCSSDEQVDCTRTDAQNGFTLEGSYHRQVSQGNRAECLQAYQYIIDSCLSKGQSTGTVAFGDGAYSYTMSVHPPSGTSPTQDIQCSDTINPQPQPFDNNLLWYMRQAYCTAGGCSGRTGECEVFVHGNGYRMKLTGSIPADQSDTQFSQVCYDATEAIINECWGTGKMGGAINVGNGESYGYYFVQGNEPDFEEVPIEL